MMRLLLLAALLLPGWTLAQAPTEKKEPSLAELARQERERKAQVKKVPIITNADLKNLKGFIGTAGTAAAAGSGEKEAAEGEPAEGDGAAPEADEKDLSEWQAEFSELTLNYKNAVNRSNLLQLKMNDLRNSYFSEDDGATQARIQQQLQETLQEIETNKQEIQQARQAIQELERQASQEGVPPGTIRKFVGELPKDTAVR